MTIWLNDDNQEDNGILDEQAVADLIEYERELGRYDADTRVFWSTLAAAGCEEEFKRKRKGGGGMTLDEAIEHAEERAHQDCTECAREHAQLAEWLRELKERRMTEAKED